MSPDEDTFRDTMFRKDLQVGTKDRVNKILEEKAQLEKEYEEKFGFQQPVSTLAAWVELFSRYV